MEPSPALGSRDIDTLSKNLPKSGRSHLLLIRGREAVLENAPLLEQLALRCGQPGAMNWMQYFLAVPEFRWKTPYLVLLTHSKTEPRALRVENVRAAVLLFEYRLFGLPTRIFCTDDATGMRTVISRLEDRQTASVSAVRALVRRGAQIVMISRDDAGRIVGVPRLAGEHPLLWARQRRPIARTLMLGPTYQSTLARLGKSTRFNLGYYRRRLLAKMPCEFVADARGMLSDADLRAINSGSLNPVTFELFKLQYASACHLPGGFLIGLRGPLGEWLSLIGGWRQGGATVLHWQQNASGYERSSLGTVMRSYFLENEIERGTRSLSFYGGTPHSMQNSFVAEEVTDLMVRQLSWQAAILVALARMVGGIQRWTGRMNFVVEALCDRSLVWKPTSQSGSRGNEEVAEMEVRGPDESRVPLQSRA
jgi:hypothetical protein